ncbi:transmembrane protein 223-like [Corythoichthys intestinalis]|uniref:transmembrane protein 223-like n=1 Tax=Corythoichthys intestinalis TaxID=161448 RepID=UPI0025A50928|nr:transmembrane protein 223-like [Corythoichthys intestinalis]XP_057709138.1 transmembrane protein 223-like [Corythoichthys intestinalis]XP_061799195.1 transmembrane protein 223-like [Nerophis lumbriciformis]
MSLLRICGALCQLRPIATQRRNALLWSRFPVSGLSIRLAHMSFAGPGRRIFAHRFCTSTQPSRDVTLFHHDRTSFFRLLSVFCGGQCVFWTYLAHFAYTGLRDTGTTAQEEKRKAPTSPALAGMWSFEMNLGSSTWRYGFTLGCATIGAGILGLGILFCRRSVCQVVLHQGGRMVSVTTQSPLGMGRGWRITAPLSQVACHAHRHESPSFIPLKIKGQKFYFLLDKEGTINNTELFDVTVGAYRPL